ncbi:hypothetical protein CSKR_110327 [Clonorchis sinensis]|uniref:Uncharacterized protein n=1 Tax=Clonorchis sinensis TaxID=79923 RepID=A0A419QDY6_CLOSI|nr:hypothetical protein CSKR_110327 [Clonorchis sinensis]
MPQEGSTKAGILPGCPSLDRGSREAEVGFEPRAFRSVNWRSNHLSDKNLAIKTLSSGKTLVMDSAHAYRSFIKQPNNLNSNTKKRNPHRIGRFCASKYNHSNIPLVSTRDSRESFVYDIIQLNVLHKSGLMFLLFVENSSTDCNHFRPFSPRFCQISVLIEPKFYEIRGIHSIPNRFRLNRRLIWVPADSLDYDIL